MSITTQSLFYALLFLAISSTALADPSDWVNIDYVVSPAARHDESTSDARSSIIRAASSTAHRGPWSVIDNNGIRAPSGNPHDYVSWAPYWWPDCNWCSSGGRNHLAHSGVGNDTQPSDEDTPPDEDDSDQEESADFVAPTRRSSFYPHIPPFHRRFIHVKKSPLAALTPSTPAIFESNTLAMDETVPLPQAPLGNPKFQVPASVTPTASHSTSERMAGTAAPAQNAVKTKKSSCTPSPTSSMPPSATWTICPYVNRDGQVNPDTRSIKDPGHINDAGQSMLYNAVSYGLSQDPTYSKRVADFVNTLLLDPKTGMNTNANYGQIVRGPGAKGTTGSWTGILDLRGLTKAYNAIAILRAMHSAEWTPAMDKSLQGWTEKWTDWLVTSSLGQKAGTRPNNHGTFYTYQLAGAQLATGNAKGAGETIKRFIETSFQDQIAASGEQPYEAVRTRPYHYRCFNLEALIGIAKIGDEIGMNVWGDRTKHGANIKDALDYVMTVDPKREDRSQIVPHVLAVATAYGDPTGEYASFLQEHSPKYRTKSSWFYNQPDAFPSTHRNREGKRGVAWPKDDDMPSAERDSVTFTCPRIFTSEPCVELDLGVCVTCEQLEEFFSS